MKYMILKVSELERGKFLILEVKQSGRKVCYLIEVGDGRGEDIVLKNDIEDLEEAINKYNYYLDLLK